MGTGGDHTLLTVIVVISKTIFKIMIKNGIKNIVGECCSKMEYECIVNPLTPESTLSLLN
jgi:hypothetical protein